MTLDDLISELEDLREAHGGETEVRLAQQPRWAFEYSVGQVAVDDGLPEEDDDDEEQESRPAVVYIGEGSQLGYLPGSAARALEWK